MEDEDEQAPSGEQPLSGADLLRGRLRELVARVHELDPQVRANADDSVHDLRVTVRRLRSNLASYAPALVADETAPIRSELQWFGARLGEVREPEVQVQRLAELGDEAGTLLARLVVEHRAARAGLLASMEEPRYAALMARLDALAAEPRFTRAAQASAEELVRSRAQEDWRRVRDRVAALPGPEDGTFPEHLHEVRKAARRLQYLLESGRPVAGDDATRLRRVTKFQRRLGDHHDATMTQELLAETGNGGNEAAREAAAVAAEFPSLWRRLTEGAAAEGATSSGDGR